jgi:hypothetical protein
LVLEALPRPMHREDFSVIHILMRRLNATCANVHNEAEDGMIQMESFDASVQEWIHLQP